MRSRRPLLTAALAVLAIGLPCLSRSQGRSAGAAPPGIRLERVFATRGDLGRGAFLRRLTGRIDPPLFQRPFGVAWDRNDLVVTDPGKGSVVRIDSRGRIRESAPDLFASPIGVASCRPGTLVSDSRSGEVSLLDRDLRLVRRVAEGLDRPTGVACDGDRIFVVETGRHRILAFEPQGWPVTGATTPRGGQVKQRDGQTFVPAGAEETAFVFAPDRLVRTLGGRGEHVGEFNFPTAIAPGLGLLWVGDTLNFRIQGFDPVTGEFDSTFGRLGDAPGEMPRLKGLAIDAAGRLWISDAVLEQIGIYRQDGTFLTALGGPGTDPGSFSFPAGLAAHPDGRVAVVDSLNRRVQVFRWVDTESEG